MPEPHVIRLRGRWEYEAETAGGLVRGVFDASNDWLAGLASPHSVRFSRRFHAPTGLTPQSRVLLVIRGAPDEMEVSLNDQLLSGATSEPSDIAARLQSSNRLELALASVPAAPLLIEVALAIEEPA